VLNFEIKTSVQNGNIDHNTSAETKHSIQFESGLASFLLGYSN